MDRSPAVGKRVAKWYADNYYVVEDDIIPIFERLETPFLDRRIKPGMRLFDAMMGRGRHAVRYASRGCIVWGNDLNPHMAVHAKKAAKHLGVKAKFTSLDATNLKGMKSNQFDVVIAMYSSIGTIPKSVNRQKAMDEFARVVKPGGMVILHAHNRLDTFLKPGFWNWVFQTYLWPEKGLETGDIIIEYNGLDTMLNHYYSPAEFRRSFRKARLRVVEEHYMDYEKRRFIKEWWRKLKADGFIFVAVKQ